MAKNSKSDAKVSSDRRAKGKERRGSSERRAKDGPVPVESRQLERRAKVNRRRQIDPTTCERDYSDDEIQFMHALEQYKRTSGRMFPTCSEILEVVRGLGYQKQSAERHQAANDAEPAGEPFGLFSAVVLGDEVPAV